MQQIPLSVIILAQADSPQLRSSIQSILFVNEIIVVDTSGTKTITSVKSSDVQLRQLSKITNFSVTRNQTLKFASNDWVLFLDSDEICVCPKVDVLLTLMEKNISAYKINRKDYFLGKALRFGETAHSHPTRLMRKNHCIYTGAVHETVVCDGLVETIDPSILELAHYPHISISGFFSKICWYSLLEAQQRKSGLCVLIFQLLVFPPTKWITNLLFKKGILDGYRGITYATLMSFHSLFVRLFQLEKTVLKNYHD